jgi:hypothetical protein
MGQDSLAERFEHALMQETQHVETISRWYEAMLAAESKVLS